MEKRAGTASRQKGGDTMKRRRWAYGFLLVFTLCLLAVMPKAVRASSAEDFTFSYDEETDGFFLTRYSGTDTKVTVPDSFDGKPVTGLGSGTHAPFSGSQRITEVILPESLTVLPYSSFYGCSALKKVEIRGELQEIHENTFWKCTALESVTIPSTVKVIEEEAFYMCESLRKITLPSSLKTLGRYAFGNCYSVTELRIPKSVKEMDTSVFSGCTSLESVTVLGPVVGRYAFDGCTALRTADVRSETIRANAFCHCPELYQVVMTSGVKTIESDVFANNSKEYLTIVAPEDSYAAAYARKENIHTSSSKKLSVRMGNAKVFVGEAIRNIEVLNAPSEASWSSSKPSVLKVGKDGSLQAKKAGSAVITVKIGKKSFRQKYTVLKRTSGNVKKILYTYYVTPQMTDYEKIVAANQWLTANVTYDQRYYTDESQIPAISYRADGVWQKGVAVCDGYARAFLEIMDHYGIPCKRLVGRADGAKGWDGHAWDLVKLGSKWYHVDPTWNDPDDGSDRYRTNTKYLLVTDSAIGENHSWTKKDYPKATSKKPDPNITHTGIYGAVLNRRTATLKKGKSVTFKVTGTKKKVSFTSGNKKVATVNSKGKVTAKAKGTAKIKVKIGGKSYTCSVTVK